MKILIISSASNRATVECKVENLDAINFLYDTSNRATVECKEVLGKHELSYKVQLLIELQ